MNKEIIFDIKVNAGNAESEIVGVSDGVNQLDKETTDLNATFEEVYGNLKPLSARLGELEDRMYELALAGKQNTQEFKELEAEAVRYRQTIIAVDHSVDQLAETGKGLAVALEIGNHVAGGYQAVQGAMALVGVENENLMETMVKLQGAQAVLNSLEQMKIALDRQSIVTTKLKSVVTAVQTKATTAYTLATTGATVATRVLNTAMLALPIVAIVAGLTSLVLWLTNTKNATIDLKEENDNLNDSYKQSTKAFTDAQNAFKNYADNQRKLMVANDATREQLFNFDKKRMQEEEVIRRQQLSQERAYLVERQSLYQEAIKQEKYEDAKNIREQIEANRDRIKQLKQDTDNFRVNMTLLEKDYQKENAKIQDEATKKASEKRKQNTEKAKQEKEREDQLALERQRLFQDLMIESIQDGDAKEIAQLNIKYQRQREDLIKKYGQDTELIKELEKVQEQELYKLLEEQKQRQIEEDNKALQYRIDRQNRDNTALLNARLLQMEDDFRAVKELEKELALEDMTQQLQNTDLTENEKLLIKEEYAKKIKDIDQEIADNEIDIRRKNIEAIENAYNDLLGSTTKLSDAFFEYQLNSVEKGSAQEESIRKKQFEYNKKLQIAQAIMQGYQAAIASYTSGAAIGGPILGGVYAGISTVATGAQIMAIKSTKYESSSRPEVNMSTPSIDTPTLKSSYNESVTSTDDFVNGNSNENQSIKVSIVDSEIKQALEKENKVNIISGF